MNLYPYKRLDENAPYGPGNPDYEYDAIVDQQLADEDRLRQEEARDERSPAA